MRVFVAGASGAIGRPLVPQLVAAGHRVTGITRRPEQAAEIESAGARAIVCDAPDSRALQAAVRDAEPDVIINQLTSLPRRYNPRSIDYTATNRVRREGGRALLAARRFITQSIAFLYAPVGTSVKSEDAPVFEDAPMPFGAGVRAVLEHEREVLSTPTIDGVVLRYGQFYGPGTYYASDGDIARQVRRRRFPLVGAGAGVTSFIHVEDAAAATVAAVSKGDPGIYNIADDKPAAIGRWLPLYASALGAEAPRRVPAWLARIAAGRAAVLLATQLRGASNLKAKRDLDWTPRYPSWRVGFRDALG